ncbi:MAG: Lrp/AsnC ligand binding domain-containing protein [Thermofilaceae archaeon]|nr:Lrp/AsnC ligand binding domain-containing protein [Thermofilaceae archaeon]MCX8180797.1 Lrp/AsnC ligand binding domain-containing protein [Thermofilaceae archaeon]MDW8004807.1 Lrp/AsnC ligand binding domain-containing protein [Thermofilaceae archaeon]
MNSGEIKIVAYLILVVEAGKEYEVLRKLLEIDAVNEAHVVYGEYDIVAKLEVSDLSELEKTVMNIRKIPGVERSTTLISA